MRDVAAFVVVVDGGVAQPVFDALAPLAVLVADADALAQGVGLFDDAPLAVVFGFELQAARRVAVAGQRVRLACVFVAVGRLRAVWLNGSGKVARRVVAVAPLHAARACDAGDAPLRVAFKAQAPAARVADAVSGTEWRMPSAANCTVLPCRSLICWMPPARPRLPSRMNSTPSRVITPQLCGCIVMPASRHAAKKNERSNMGKAANSEHLPR